MGMKSPLLSLVSYQRGYVSPSSMALMGATGMKSLAIYVGLDYHQSSVQVCVVRADGEVLMNNSCDNVWQAIARRVSIFGAAVQAGIEACGGAADLAEELTRHAGGSIELAHPG